MYHKSSFCRITNQSLCFQQVFSVFDSQLQSTPESINSLIIIWSNEQLSECNKDQQTFQILRGIEKQAQVDSYYFTKLENLLTLQTSINFINDRLEKLTGIKIQSSKKILRRKLTHWILRTVQAITMKNIDYIKTQRSVFRDIQDMQLFYTHFIQTMNKNTLHFRQNVMKFLTLEAQSCFLISKEFGLLDTILLSHKSETKYMVFSFLSSRDKLKELGTSKESYQYQQNQQFLLKWQAILASYKNFIFDNRSLELDSNPINLFRDQSFFPDIEIWINQVNEFINQAFINNIYPAQQSQHQPFIDIIDLQISDQNNTRINNLEDQFGRNYEPLLISKKLFMEKGQKIDNLLFTHHIYFYVLALSLSITYNIKQIEDRKWIALITLQSKERANFSFDQDQCLPTQLTINSVPYDFQKIQSLFFIGQGYGQTFEMKVLQIAKGVSLVHCLEIEQQGKKEISQGLEQFLLQPILKVLTDWYNEIIEPFIILNVQDTQLPTIKLDIDRILNVERACYNLGQVLLTQYELIASKIDFFVHFLANVSICFENESMFKNQELFLQLKSIQRKIGDIFRLIIYGTLYLHSENKDQETRTFLRLLSHFFSKENFYQYSSQAELKEMISLILIQFMFHPLPNNPINFRSFERQDFLDNILFEKFKFKVQSNNLEQFKRADKKEIQIICPHYINSILRTFNDNTTIHDFYDSLYKTYLIHDNEGKSEHATEILRMMFQGFQLIKSGKVLENQLTKFQIFYMRTKYALGTHKFKQIETDQCQSMCLLLSQSDQNVIPDSVKDNVDTDFIFQNVENVVIALIMNIPGRISLLEKIISRKQSQDFIAKILSQFQRYDKLIQYCSKFEKSQYELLYKSLPAQITKTYLNQISLTEAARSKSLQTSLLHIMNYLLSGNTYYKFSLEEVTQLFHYLFDWTHFLQSAEDLIQQYQINTPGKIGENSLPQVFGAWGVFRDKWNNFMIDGELEKQVNKYNQFVHYSSSHAIIVQRSLNFVNLLEKCNQTEINSIIDIIRKQNIFMMVITYLRKTYKFAANDEVKPILAEIPRIPQYFSTPEMKTIVLNCCSVTPFVIQNQLDFLLSQQKWGKFYRLFSKAKDWIPNHNLHKFNKSSTSNLQKFMKQMGKFYKIDEHQKEANIQYQQSYFLAFNDSIITSVKDLVQEMSQFTDIQMDPTITSLDVNSFRRILQYQFQFIMYQDFIDYHYQSDSIFQSIPENTQIFLKKMENDNRFQFDLIRYYELNLLFVQNLIRLNEQFRIYDKFHSRFYDQLIENLQVLQAYPQINDQQEILRIMLSHFTQSCINKIIPTLRYSCILFFQLPLWTNEQKQIFAQVCNICVYHPINLYQRFDISGMYSTLKDIGDVIKLRSGQILIQQIETMVHQLEQALLIKVSNQQCQSQNLDQQAQIATVNQKKRTKDDEFCDIQVIDDQVITQPKIFTVLDMQSQIQNLMSRKKFMEEREIFKTHFAQLLQMIYLDAYSYNPSRITIRKGQRTLLSHILHSSVYLKNQQSLIPQLDHNNIELLLTNQLSKVYYRERIEGDDQILQLLNPSIIKMFEFQISTIEDPHFIIKVITQLNALNGKPLQDYPEFFEQSLRDLFHVFPLDNDKIYHNAKAILQILKLLMATKKPNNNFSLEVYALQIIDQVSFLIKQFPKSINGDFQGVQVKWIKKIDKFLFYLVPCLEQTQQQQAPYIKVDDGSLGGEFKTINEIPIQSIHFRIEQLLSSLYGLFFEIDIKVQFLLGKQGIPDLIMPIMYLTQFSFQHGLNNNCAKQNIKFLLRNTIKAFVKDNSSKFIEIQGLIEIEKHQVIASFKKIQTIYQQQSNSHLLELFQEIFIRKIPDHKNQELFQKVPLDDFFFSSDSCNFGNLFQENQSSNEPIDVIQNNKDNDDINLKTTNIDAQVDQPDDNSQINEQVIITASPEIQQKEQYFINLIELSRDDVVEVLDGQSLRIVQDITNHYLTIQEQHIDRLKLISEYKNCDTNACFWQIYSKQMYQTSLIPFDNCQFIVCRLIKCYPLYIDQILDQKLSSNGSMANLLLNTGFKKNLSLLENLVLFDQFNCGSQFQYLIAIIDDFKVLDEAKYHTLVLKIFNTTSRLLIQILDAQDLDNLDQTQCLSRLISCFTLISNKVQNNIKSKLNLLDMIQRVIKQAKNLTQIDLLNSIGLCQLINQIYDQYVKQKIFELIKGKMNANIISVEETQNIYQSVNWQVLGYYQNKFQYSCFNGLYQQDKISDQDKEQLSLQQNQLFYSVVKPNGNNLKINQESFDVIQRCWFLQSFQEYQEVKHTVMPRCFAKETINLFNDLQRKKYYRSNQSAKLAGYNATSKIFTDPLFTQTLKASNYHKIENGVRSHFYLKSKCRKHYMNYGYTETNFIFDDIEQIQGCQDKFQKIHEIEEHSPNKQKQYQGEKKDNQKDSEDFKVIETNSEEIDDKIILTAMNMYQQEPVKVKNEETDNNFEIYIEKGFPADALKLYEIDETNFWKCDKKQKKAILKEGRLLYERKQKQLKYSNYLTDYETFITSKYINSLKNEAIDDSSLMRVYSYMQQGEFSKWFELQSPEERLLILTTCDARFISLLPESLQTSIKEQWKLSCKLDFKKNSQLKYDLNALKDQLQDKYEESQKKIKEQQNEAEDSIQQLEQINPQIQKADAITDIQSQNQSQTEQQTKKDQESQDDMLQKIIINQEIDTTKGLQSVLDDPEFFGTLYRVDIEVIEKVLELQNCDNGKFLIAQFLDFIILDPHTSLQLIIRTYIRLQIGLNNLKKGLKQNYKQFFHIKVSEFFTDQFGFSDQVLDLSQGFVKQDWLQARINNIEAQVKILQVVLDRCVFQDFMIHIMNEESFWLGLKISRHVQVNFNGQQYMINFEEMLSERYLNTLNSILEQTDGNIQNLFLFDVIKRVQTLLDQLVHFQSYSIDLFQSVQRLFSQYQLNLSKIQSCRTSINKFTCSILSSQFEEDQLMKQEEKLSILYNYPTYIIKPQNTMNILISILFQSFHQTHIKDKDQQKLIENLTRANFLNTVSLAQDIFFSNFHALQDIFSYYKIQLKNFHQKFMDDTGQLNLNDRTKFEDQTQFILWIDKYEELISQLNSYKSQKNAAKMNVQFFKRQIRKVVEFQLLDNNEFYARAKQSINPETEDQQLLDIIDQEIKKLEKPLYSHFYDVLINSDNQIILSTLQTILQTIPLFDKIMSSNSNDIVDYTKFDVQFKTLILFYELEVRVKGVSIQANKDRIKYQEDTESFQNLQQSDDQIVPSPPPKLSKLFTKEYSNDQTIEIDINNSRSPSFTKKSEGKLILKEIYDQFVNKFSGFALLMINQSSSKVNIWLRLLKANNIKMNLEQKISMIMSNLRSESYTDDADDEYQQIEIKVNREYVWGSTLAVLAKKSIYSLINNPFDIKFINESGIDAGGLSAEWITLVMKEVMDPQVGLFQLSANNVTFQPNPHSHLITNHLTHFRYIGRLIASTILSKIPLEVDLTRSVLKHITKQPLYIADLEDIDPELSKNLLRLLEIDVSPLYLTYNHYESVFGELICIDLGQGFDSPVTNENKKEYVKQVANYKMTLQIKEQIESLVGGFEDVIPRRFLRDLEFQELGLKLSGLKHIDMDDFRKNLLFDGYNKDDNEIIWILDILENDFTEQQRANFLFFISGSFKVHHGGFKEMKVKFSKCDKIQNLPVAHTCFNALDLPTYKSRSQMKEKIIMAMEESQGFYIS